MEAVVLVGGFGTRLRPLTFTTPKNLLPVAQVPMVERVVGHLAAHGVTRAVLSLGYRPDVFLDAYPDGICAGVELVYAVEEEPLDTAGAIRFAATEAGISQRFLAVNGDILTDLDVTRLVRFHEASDAKATVALHTVDDPSRYGVVVTDVAGRVEAFIEKPSAAEAPSHDINAGTYVFEPSVLDMIASDRRVSVERETFPALAEAKSLYAMTSSGYWLDAGTPETYLRANLDLVAQDSVLVDDSADVAKATITHSVIGRGAVVADGASITDSVIMDGVTVGPGAVIDRSMVGAGSVIGADAQLLAHTVVGYGVEIESGAVLESASVPEVEAAATTGTV